MFKNLGKILIDNLQTQIKELTKEYVRKEKTLKDIINKKKYYLKLLDNKKDITEAYLYKVIVFSLKEKTITNERNNAQDNIAKCQLAIGLVQSNIRTVNCSNLKGLMVTISEILLY